MKPVSESPLADLIGPLTYATRAGSPIERIGGLPELVTARVRAWQRGFAGDSSQNRQAVAWLRQMDGYAGLTPSQRRVRLTGMLTEIVSVCGVELPARVTQSGGPAPGRTAAPGARRFPAHGSPRKAAAGRSPSGAGGAARERAKPSSTRVARAKAVAKGADKSAGTGTAVAADDDVRVLPGVGDRRASRLQRLGIHTLGDLLLHLPTRHEDRRHAVPLGELRAGETATVVGEVVRAELHTTARRRMRIFEAVVSDGSPLGTAIVARWFNQPHRARQIHTGTRYRFHGRVVVDRSGIGLVLDNPEVTPETEVEANTDTAALTAIYPATEGVTSTQLRAWVGWALDRVAIAETLPKALRRELALPERAAAFASIHRPTTPEDAANGVRRLAFEEFFTLQLGLLRRRSGARRPTDVCFPDVSGPLQQALAARLPFALTGAQQRALAEVYADLARPVPMQRLLQGDVGCGKTLVALFALLRAVDAGYQGVIMAPTEVLAEQHFRKISAWLDGLPVATTLVVGGPQARNKSGNGTRNDALAGLADGRVGIAVGTHALIQDRVVFQRLGMAVIDEQHRFGVRQRAQLGAKGAAPHVLAMTATPIPRSLAMTVYGDLDLSVIDEVPPGRGVVTTEIVPVGERNRVYDRVRREVQGGGQVFVVHPLVEASEKIDLSDATAAYETLSNGVLRGIPIALLHGRMKPEEKGAVMAAFARGATRVLVTTTVVEVGVDVSAATAMVVEHAERFGLSQLHQLRGRVGRGGQPGWCALITPDDAGDDARARLEALVASRDGFRIAERDLEIRGPGELFGRRQSGVPELRVANLIRDGVLLEAARTQARTLLAADPHLTRPEHAELAGMVRGLWRHHLKWGSVG